MNRAVDVGFDGDVCFAGEERSKSESEKNARADEILLGDSREPMQRAES